MDETEKDHDAVGYGKHPYDETCYGGSKRNNNGQINPTNPIRNKPHRRPTKHYPRGKHAGDYTPLLLRQPHRHREIRKRVHHTHVPEQHDKPPQNNRHEPEISKKRNIEGLVFGGNDFYAIFKDDNDDCVHDEHGYGSDTKGPSETYILDHQICTYREDESPGAGSSGTYSHCESPSFTEPLIWKGRRRREKQAHSNTEHYPLSQEQLPYLRSATKVGEGGVGYFCRP
jgi:hypothetical protein